ncbi:MAG: c-type cytochrome [Polyangiaceae bacterium]|nr:c-type cytochrome [Polyangiaceae bacterium]
MTSCTLDRDKWDPDQLAHGKYVAVDESLARGRASYNDYCAGCHGEKGDGEGPAAKFLKPKPRDFRKGKVKFASVAAGEMPTDDDLIRTIQRGLHGTSMPSWRLLPKDEILDIIQYVKTFTPNRKAPGGMIAIPADPWLKAPEKGVAEGEKLYHGLANCNSCHPAYVEKPKMVEHMKAFDMPLSGFREKPYDSETKDSEWGEAITPPDFLSDYIKSGTAKEDLVRVIATGVGGTAMPSWGATLTPKQLWGLAYYVEHLASLRGTKKAQDMRKALLEQPPYTPPPPPPPPPPPETTADPSASASASAAPSSSASAAPTTSATAAPK